MRFFPVDPANPFSTKTMVRAVRDGERLVVFPEGRITTTGALMKVYEGAGMVADKAEAPSVPVRIDWLAVHHVLTHGRPRAAALVSALSLTVLPPVRLALGRGVARPRTPPAPSAPCCRA